MVVGNRLSSSHVRLLTGKKVPYCIDVGLLNTIITGRIVPFARSIRVEQDVDNDPIKSQIFMRFVKLIKGDFAYRLVCRARVTREEWSMVSK